MLLEALIELDVWIACSHIFLKLGALQKGLHQQIYLMRPAPIKDDERIVQSKNSTVSSTLSSIVGAEVMKCVLRIGDRIQTGMITDIVEPGHNVCPHDVTVTSTSITGWKIVCVYRS